MNAEPTTLTIAGFDPSGGAGVIADIRAFAAFNCHPAAVVTAITFQNDDGVSSVVVERPETVRGQLLALLGESGIAAVKTGMLPTREIVNEVVRALSARPEIPLVIDPVMRSTSGYELMDASAYEELKTQLMPLARLITPNIPEAEKFVGFKIVDVGDMQRAAERIRKLGARAVLVKGGHLDSSLPATDVLNDEGTVTIFTGERIPTSGVRGTGCTLASAIAAGLARGNSLEQSITRAREFLAAKLR
jgi:hydroxymethylpyrimidine/phosphomethylpyrimidine kinase